MSMTFSLVCQEKKLKIWVGQGRTEMDVFYSGEPQIMNRLGRFLEATRGNQLVLVRDFSDYDECSDYQEFEEKDEP